MVGGDEVAGGDIDGGGAMASMEKLGGEYRNRPTGHERTNGEHWVKEKEIANSPRATTRPELLRDCGRTMSSLAMVVLGFHSGGMA